MRRERDTTDMCAQKMALEDTEKWWLPSSQGARPQEKLKPLMH